MELLLYLLLDIHEHVILYYFFYYFLLLFLLFGANYPFFLLFDRDSGYILPACGVPGGAIVARGKDLAHALRGYDNAIFATCSVDVVYSLHESFVLLLLLGGGILLGLGLIGNYIAAIYDEVKGRPRYIVRLDTDKILKRD